MLTYSEPLKDKSSATRSRTKKFKIKNKYWDENCWFMSSTGIYRAMSSAITFRAKYSQLPKPHTYTDNMYCWLVWLIGFFCSPFALVFLVNFWFHLLFIAERAVWVRWPKNKKRRKIQNKKTINNQYERIKSNIILPLSIKGTKNIENLARSLTRTHADCRNLEIIINGCIKTH